jgi:hypothetical protein
MGKRLSRLDIDPVNVWIYLEMNHIQNLAKKIGIQIKIQISKIGKIEKKSKAEKNREESLPDQSPLAQPISQSTRSPGSVPFCSVTDGRDPHGGEDHLLPLHLQGFDTPPATSRTTPSS